MVTPGYFLRSSPLEVFPVVSWVVLSLGCVGLLGFVPLYFVFIPPYGGRCPRVSLVCQFFCYFSPVIGWLWYFVFNDFMKYLDAEIASLFEAIYGMHPLCVKN